MSLSSEMKVRLSQLPSLQKRSEGEVFSQGTAALPVRPQEDEVSTNREITQESTRSITPIVRLLLIGTRDSHSPLSTIGTRPLRTILGMWRDLLRLDITTDGTFACIVSKEKIPSQTGIYVNMMPFVLGKMDTLPMELWHYYNLIQACLVALAPEDGKVGYLTIMESTVNGGSQRRGGLHTEGGFLVAEALETEAAEAESSIDTPTFHQPGSVSDNKVDAEVSMSRLKKAGFKAGKDVLEEYDPTSWGGGRMRAVYTGDILEGGVFMASNVTNSCRVWNGQVDPAGIGPLGNIETHRDVLGPGATLNAGELMWITDLTPHESLPLPEGTRRTYFRLCTSALSVWYAKHSTPNPLGILPGPEVRIVDTDKFDGIANPLGITSGRKDIPWSFGVGDPDLYEQMQSSNTK